MTKEALKLSLEALEEAADAIDSWGSYASGYFQVKHDLESDISKAKSAITAIKEALAQPEKDGECKHCTDGCPACDARKLPEQEPIATLWQHGETGRTRITMPDDITDCDARWFKAADLYTTPPQRKPLSDERIWHLVDIHVSVPCPSHPLDNSDWVNFARAIEAAHGIKGEA